MKITAVRNIPESYNLVTDTQEADAIREQHPEAAEYDSFFVQQQDGEVIGLFGFCGSVPYLSKLARQII